jgi:hypothetical protein
MNKMNEWVDGTRIGGTQVKRKAEDIEEEEEAEAKEGVEAAPLAKKVKVEAAPPAKIVKQPQSPPIRRAPHPVFIPSRSLSMLFNSTSFHHNARTGQQGVGRVSREGERDVDCLLTVCLYLSGAGRPHSLR